MFPTIEYINWISGRPEVALHDLGTSELWGDRDHEPRPIPPILQNKDDPPTGATLEVQLAQKYDVQPQQVVITAGASQANFLSIATKIQQRNESHVLVEKPTYEPLRKIPAALGATVNRFSRSEQYEIDPKVISQSLTPETDLIIITNRHNPSGVSTSRDTLTQIAQLAVENDCYLLIDEVYGPYRDPDSATDRGLGGISGVGLDNTIITNSLTKFYGLGDVRIGWVIGPQETIEDVRKIKDYSQCVGQTNRALGQRALHHSDDMESRAYDLIRQNSAILSDFVAQRSDIAGFVPENNTFCFVKCTTMDGDQLVNKAWEQGILLVPGRFFEDSDRIRISLGRSPENSEAALTALSEVLDETKQ
ncbi:MAG: pyridoxal phosphate-dependent aminotransferase [Halobacteriaceae archaeon]